MADLNQELEDLICEDMGKIWHEVGGQDGMYENFPISRVYRNGEYVRCYALSSYGGVAIISLKKYNEFRIVTLGEDDGYHFLRSSDTYEHCWGNKLDFVALISEALSLFNNIEI